jgi:hypothetical protein
MLRGEERAYVRFTTRFLILRDGEVSIFVASPSKSQNSWQLIIPGINHGPVDANAASLLNWRTRRGASFVGYSATTSQIV